MRPLRVLTGAFAGFGLLLSGLAVADATPETETTANSYIVVFDTAQSDAAYASITAAGGAVTDVNGQLGFAEVTAGPTLAADLAAAPGIMGVARDHSIGSVDPAAPPVVATDRLTVRESGGTGTGSGVGPMALPLGPDDPLSSYQWDMAMIGATGPKAHRRADGRGVQVAIIDTGVDATHPDLAANFDHVNSQNFTQDIPAIDGPCADEPDGSCDDPADIDEGGHGTHVAGTVAAARNGVGITGVAPRASIVNLRAGQDSGYFFLLPTINALTAAGDIGVDVANMSFYTDPWLFNCESADDYISGAVTEEEIAEQSMIRSAVLQAVTYAHDHGVTLVAAAGNGHYNFALEQRPDLTSPDYPPGTEAPRVVTNNCLDLPAEAPEVISVSAVGPSTTKSDYSDYGVGHVEISAPGGWYRDGIGTPSFQTPGNLILSSYPHDLAFEEGLIDENDQPTDGFSVTDCSVTPCAVYTYLQGTSMASPHVAGVAALVVNARGSGDATSGYSLAPDTVRSILLTTATGHDCPVGGVEIYTDEGRTPDYNAICTGTRTNNGLWGEGIVSAIRAVAPPKGAPPAR